MLTTSRRPAVQAVQASCRVTAKAPHEQPDGSWTTTCPLPQWPGTNACLRLGAATHGGLQQLLGRLEPSLQTLQELAAALAANDLRGAAAPFAALQTVAVDLRAPLIDAYHQWPDAAVNQAALGLVCLAAGRSKEAEFHLLRAGSRFCSDAPHGLLIGAAALQLVGEAAAARRMLAVLRRLVDTARIAGICRRFHPHVVWTRPDLLRHVRGVLQVGANVGDESECWSALGMRNLIAFEPVPSAFATLQDNLQRHAPEGATWTAVPLAVADRCGEFEFWQGLQTGNSSFFELHPTRSEFHQRNRHDRRIVVTTTTLDDYFAGRDDLVGQHNLMFIDVQGAEHLVILGAKRCLSRIDYVVMELSEAEIYTGTKSIAAMDELMAQHDFDKVAQLPNGFPEQVDALYARRGAPQQ